MTIIDDGLIEGVETNSSALSSYKVDPFVNESSIFYKGLFGMLLCLTPGSVIGLVLVNISLNQSKEAISSIGKKSQEYGQARFRKIKQGRTMAYIGLTFFVVELIALVVLMSLN